MEGLAGVERPLLEERHHPLRPWVIAGALAVVVAALAGAFYYSPLASGALTCPPPAELIAPEESEEGIQAQPRCLVEQQGRPVELVVGTVVRNEGRLPMTVEEVRLPDGIDELLDITAVRSGPAGGARDRFTPFRLAPDEARHVELRLRLAACGERSDRLITAAHLPLRVRFLGLPKTTELALGTELSVLRRRC